MPPVTLGLSDPDSLGTLLWENFWNPENGAIVQEVCKRNTERYPIVETFPVELIDVTVTELDQGSSNVSGVQPGTHKAVIDSWNLSSLVGSHVLVSSNFCGAVIGNEVKPALLDCKVCDLQVAGPTSCKTRSPQVTFNTRIPQPDGEYMLAIGLPIDGMVSKVILSPLLHSKDLIQLS